MEVICNQCIMKILIEKSYMAHRVVSNTCLFVKPRADVGLFVNGEAGEARRKNVLTKRHLKVVSE